MRLAIEQFRVSGVYKCPRLSILPKGVPSHGALCFHLLFKSRCINGRNSQLSTACTCIVPTNKAAVGQQRALIGNEMGSSFSSLSLRRARLASQLTLGIDSEKATQHGATGRWPLRAMAPSHHACRLFGDNRGRCAQTGGT